MIKVKLRKDLAVRGLGFLDIEAGQEMFPRDKKGNIDADKVFEVKETQFVNSKISTGELIVISRDNSVSEQKESETDSLEAVAPGSENIPVPKNGK